VLGFFLGRKKRIGIVVEERVEGGVAGRGWERRASGEAVGGGRTSHYILFLLGGSVGIEGEVECGMKTKRKRQRVALMTRLKLLFTRSRSRVSNFAS
jgi:hypothetical protein